MPNIGINSQRLRREIGALPAEGPDPGIVTDGVGVKRLSPAVKGAAAGVQR